MFKYICACGKFIGVHIFTHFNPFVPICTHLYPFVPICTHLYPFVPICTHFCPFLPIFTHFYPFLPIFTHFSIHFRICRYIHYAEHVQRELNAQNEQPKQTQEISKKKAKKELGGYMGGNTNTRWIFYSLK
jgi:hypothetical protein